MIQNALIEIFSTQMGISTGGENFKHPVVNNKNADIKGASTQIEH